MNLIEQFVFWLGGKTMKVRAFDVTRGLHYGLPPSTPLKEMTVEQLKNTDWYWSASPGLRERLEKQVMEVSDDNVGLA